MFHQCGSSRSRFCQVCYHTIYSIAKSMFRFVSSINQKKDTFRSGEESRPTRLQDIDVDPVDLSNQVRDPKQLRDRTCCCEGTNREWCNLWKRSLFQLDRSPRRQTFRRLIDTPSEISDECIRMKEDRKMKKKEKRTGMISFTVLFRNLDEFDP